MLRAIRWIAYGLVLLSAVFWASVWLNGGVPEIALRAAEAVGLIAPAPGGTQAQAAPLQVGGPFTLTDQTGKTVTDADFRGKWMLIYFGYSFCPDVCPTELQTISAVLDKMGAAAKQLVPVFITVDPARDTPAALGEYLKLFDDRLVGLTGSSEQIADVARRYRVYYAKVAAVKAPGSRDGAETDGTYLMDHSSFLYLVGPDGRFRALFRQGMDVDALAAEIGQRMAAGS